ncbi:hypothetical protein [Streptomyces sp. JW3]|uniref:hypothetical protein n=1 Tax=Streptomyces sp. JW3 TaxID=3456955 RepID=UPI003FA4785F
MRVRVVPAVREDFDSRVLNLLGEDDGWPRPGRREPPPHGAGLERRWYAVDDAYFREGVDVPAEPGMTAADLLDAVVPAMYAAGLSWLSPAVAGPVLERLRAERTHPWSGLLSGTDGVLLPGGERLSWPYARRPDGERIRWEDLRLSGDERVLTGIRLLDERGLALREEVTVAELGLADGDTLQFFLSWERADVFEEESSVDHLMVGAPTPEHMFAMLQAAAAEPYGPATPRLWGVLLYTEADTGIATYIRTHFDELNALTGPTLGIMVLERPAKWSTVRRYWRQTLDPPLFRVFSAMRWLAWQPYDRHRSHDIARELDIPPDRLPCLALFRATEPRDRLVFPLAEATPAYFRRLFGAISEAVGPNAPRPDGPRMWRRRDDFSHRHDPDPDAAAQDAVASVRALTGTPADPAHQAFDRVRAAEERILAALRPLPDQDQDQDQDQDRDHARQYELHGHNVLFIRHEGGSVADQFTFHGQTTFINRPVDTVVRDFQNTHATVPHQEHLTRLLHAVLASDLPDADREQAARTITQAGDSLAAPEPDHAAARSRLESLRTLLTGTAGVAQPALEILNSLLPLLSS